MLNYTHFIDYNTYQGRFHDTDTEFHPPKKHRLTKLIRNNHLCH